jgi:hypothetical protein
MYKFINNINRHNSTPIHKWNTINNINTGAIINNINYESKTVSLFSQPYLDTSDKCYKNIVVLNLQPKGPLAKITKFVKFPPLSEFKQNTNSKQCGYALISLNNGNNYNNNNYNNYNNHLMTTDEVPDLISFLLENNYTVDTSITKMFNTSEIKFDTSTGNKLICFITYIG